MKFTIENHDGYALVVSHVEKLDSLHSSDVKSELVYLIKSGQKNLIIDLSESRYCDSSGLSALLTGNRLCKDAEGTFVICALQPSVEKLIQISQLNSVFNITPTRNEAIDLVMMEDLERDISSKDEKPEA